MASRKKGQTGWLMKVKKDLNLRSWEAKNVCSFVACFHYGKSNCGYYSWEEDYNVAYVVLYQKLESI